MLDAAKTLNKTLAKLAFDEPVTHVYNPLEYAFENYAQYVDRFGKPGKRAIFIGMNPGPWGMAQTGVPFGDAQMVRDWLGIRGHVGKPKKEHPKRAVLGFDCPRKEVSGSRLWGAIKAHYKTPDKFFERFFIANYCPLMFMEDTGRNRTPDRLLKAQREPLLAACDQHLLAVIDYLAPEMVVGIGGFAEERAKLVLEAAGRDDVAIGRILHPSPASPKANKDWVGTVKTELSELGLCGA
ncbi:MAG: single-stranded DNA-binding protein [Myxococcales bacterium]|nr:single-stranded DNA-binding protein [Myxococcales bacterium]